MAGLILAVVLPNLDEFDLSLDLDGITEGNDQDVAIAGDVALALPAETGSAPPLLVVTRRYDRSAGAVVWALSRLEPTATRPTWAVPLPDGTYTAPMAHSGDRVIHAAGRRVAAHSVIDGTALWSAEVVDVVQGTCENCLVIVGDQVVVTSIDATVTALSLADGSTTWQRRLIDPRGVAHRAGDEFVLLVDTSTDARGATVEVIEVSTGAPLTNFAPECPGPTTNSTTPLSQDAVVVDLGGGDVLLGYGSGPACAERRSADGTLAYQAVLDDAALSEREPWALAGTWFAVADRSGDLIVLDVEDATRADLVAGDDERIIPIAGTGTLSTITTTTRGSASWTVSLLDPATRTVLSAVEMGSALPLDQGLTITGIVSTGERAFTTSSDGGRLAIVAVDGTTADVDVLVVEADDPEAPAVSRVIVERPLAVLSVTPLAWTSTHAIMRVGDTAVAAPWSPDAGEPVTYGTG